MSKQWRWYVYVVECAYGLYYTGMTWDLDLRMQQHASGKGSDFTKRHGFKEIKWSKEFTDVNQARECEHKVKDFSRKKKEALWKEKLD